MIGAIIGDIVGPRFEWNNIRQKILTVYRQLLFHRRFGYGKGLF